MESMTAVSIQGGAMRSVYCIGVLRSLLINGKLTLPIKFVTSSAGCVTGLLALASELNVDKYKELTNALLEKMASSKFINKNRIYKIVDVDYLVDTLISLLSDSNILGKKSCITLDVSITEENGRARYISFNTASIDLEDLRLALRGSMAIPIFYREKVIINTVRCFDGGIIDPLPLFRSLEGGDIRTAYAISNVPQSRMGHSMSKLETLAIRLWPTLPREVKHVLLSRNALGDATARVIKLNRFGNVSLVGFSPDPNADLGSRLNIDKTHLYTLEQMGFNDAQTILSASMSSR